MMGAVLSIQISAPISFKSFQFELNRSATSLNIATAIFKSASVVAHYPDCNNFHGCAMMYI